MPMSGARPEDMRDVNGNGDDSGVTSSPEGVSPYATGGGGVTFERKAAVMYLARLLVDDAGAGIGDGCRVVSVAFQQAPAHSVDDLVVQAQRPEELEPSLVLALGVRRSLNVLATDERAQRLVRQFVDAVISAPVDGPEHRLGLVVAGSNDHSDQLGTLADLAAVQMDAHGFFDLVRTPRKFNANIRDRLEQLSQLVAHALADLGDAEPDAALVESRTWQLLSRLSVMMPRLESPDDTDWSNLANSLIPIARGRGLEGALRLRDRLVALAGEYSPNAARVDLKLLRRDAHLALDATVRRNQQGWQRLDHLHQRVLGSVREEIVADDGRRRHLDRSDQAACLLATVTEAEATIVSGGSGVGKSALVVRSLTDAAQTDPGLMQVVLINLRSVPALTVELDSILGCPLSVLLSELSAPKRLLVVDSAQAVTEGHHDAFCYLVDAARDSDVGVVAVTNVDSREFVHELLVWHFGAGVAEYPVPLLSDTEVDQLVETFAELDPFTSNPGSRDLLRRLRVVDRLVRCRVAGMPLTDADLVQDVRPGRGRRHELSDAGSPHERELALLTLVESETIDSEHAAARRVVALAQHVPTSPEGSAVDPSPEMVPAGCELRYALILPWLVAPDPNSEGSITAAEGVALLAQGRFRGLKNRSDRNEDVPDPANPKAAVEWGWSFVAAIWDWATTDSTALLEAVFESAPDTRSAAASGVFVACALARLERHRDAVEVLTPLAGHDEMDPVDRAWVLVQRARVSAELGELQDCRADAAQARDLLAGHGNDMTASAITAAAAWQQYMVAPAEGGDHMGDYLAVVAATDNSVSRRRWQLAGRGLASAVDAGFRQWAQELSITIAGSRDHGEMDLFGAELCADLAGDHSAWKTFASLLARLRIQHAAGSNNETNELAEGLDALLCSGDDKNLKLALGHLLWDGPIDVAASAVSRIGTDGWTRTTVPTRFAALETAGDLLDEDAAGEMLARVAHTAGDGFREFLDRYQPPVTVDFAAYRAMAGLVPAAARAAHSSIAAFIAAQRTDLPDVMARHLARQLDWLDFHSVESDSRSALSQIALTESYVGTRIRGWFAANGDAEALGRLKSQATEGDLDALAELTDVELLSGAEAAAVISVLDERARELLLEMREGRYNTGSSNTLDALTLLNLQFPDTARWTVVHEVLREPLALADQKSTICIRLAALSDLLPASERDLIVANIGAVAIAKEGFWPGTNMAGADIIVAVALGAMDADEADAAVTRLALGSHQQRTNAAKLLGLGHCPGMRPILTQLIRDPHPPVRLEAARSIGKLAARTPDALTAALARHVVRSNGMYLPRALLGGLSLDPPPLNDTSEELATHLQAHPSARIRRQAGLLLQS